MPDSVSAAPIPAPASLPATLQQLVELEADAQQGQEAAPVGTPYWMAPEVGQLSRVPGGRVCLLR